MDSNLVNYVKISPNCTPMTDKKIRKITIHHMAGNLSVERCGEVFSGTRQASSNYGIGSDGRVGLYVHEKDRAWTSSNRENDAQAITIEVANDTLSPTWTVSAKAYEKLIELCVDICKRYNIVPSYDGTKNGTFTEHRMFAATLCPGPYLHARMSQIVNDVKKRLDVKIEEPVLSCKYKDDDYVWKTLMGTICNPIGVAGLMGNLFAESHLYANNLQNSFNNKLGLTDAEYTNDVDTGKYNNFIKDGAGYGIAQWTFWTRKCGLMNMAQLRHTSISDIRVQVEYLCDELNSTYGSVLIGLKAAKTVREAAEIVLKQFEKPANQSESVVQERTGYAQQFYDKYAGKKVLYRVQAGAFSMKANADRTLKKMKNLGFKDAIIVVSNGLYKIQLGAYNKYENAVIMLNKIKNAGYKDAWITEG